MSDKTYVPSFFNENNIQEGDLVAVTITSSPQGKRIPPKVLIGFYSDNGDKSNSMESPHYFTYLVE